MGQEGREHDVVIIGGCGHVGLPLGIAFADAGLRVRLYDTSEPAVELINDGTLPFMEPGAAEPLARSVKAGSLLATNDPSVVADAEFVVVVIGTPVDEHLNPDPNAIPSALEPCVPYLDADQLLVLRSTVYPGVTASLERRMAELVPGLEIVFCPERIAEGRAMTELYTLPQIVGARTDKARSRAGQLFSTLTVSIVDTTPEEAELAKLFTNVYRYVKFAVANQFFAIANDAGVDYDRVRTAVRQDYPRAADLPGSGFAAGPCLFKDTMQLSAFNDNQFVLGHSAMLVNEGLPLYLVSRMEQRYDLPSRRVGILGMAFKAESDDRRESLSYKLKKVLRFKAAQVLTTDPFVTDDPELLPLAEVVQRSNVLVVGAPHDQYRDLELPEGVEVVDVWNLFGNGTLV
jgi:UDP-N-acetyl-D-mannosaminuronic acid dehydrogenase